MYSAGGALRARHGQHSRRKGVREDAEHAVDSV